MMLLRGEKQTKAEALISPLNSELRSAVLCVTPLLHQPNLIERRAPSYMLLLGSGYSSDIKTRALDRKS